VRKRLAKENGGRTDAGRLHAKEISNQKSGKVVERRLMAEVTRMRSATACLSGG